MQHLQKVKNIEYVSPIFLGKLMESYFINCFNIKNNIELREYIDIKNLINKKNFRFAFKFSVVLQLKK